MQNGNENAQLGAEAEKRIRLMKRATYASVTVALTLIAIKLSAWLYIGSVALLGSLADSSLDLLASLTTLFAIHHAVEPADREHRFGHGKLEAIAGLGQAAIIIGSAVFLAYQSVDRFLNPRVVENSTVGIVVLVISIALTLLLVRYQQKVARDTGSLAIGADSLHYKADLMMNVAVITALLLSGYLNWTLADPVFGLGIAVYIGFNAFQIARQAFDMLMDHEMPHEDRIKICDITLAHEHVRSMHDLRTRTSGFNHFIQLHIELDPEMKLKQVHDICDDVEMKIAAAYPDAEILIHPDPEGLEVPHNVFGQRPEAVLEQNNSEHADEAKAET